MSEVAALLAAFHEATGREAAVWERREGSTVPSLLGASSPAFGTRCEAGASAWDVPAWARAQGIVAYLALRYGLAALYLMGRPGLRRGTKLVLLLAGTPLAILLNVALLTPTRYIALLRLFDNRWQTRQTDPNTPLVAGRLGRVAA